ncbi:oxidoreductase, partial [Streptomyces parvus]
GASRAGAPVCAGGGYSPPARPTPGGSPHTGYGGRSWRQSATPPPAYRSGVTWLPYSRTAALAVGPTGTDLTLDGGRSWRTVDPGSYDTVDCTPDLGCWAAGEKGRVARLGF